MDLQKFDSTLKSALDNLEVPYDPGSWDTLAQRLDAMPEADAVDKALRPVLEHVEMPYAPDTWNVLAHRMDAIARTRRVRVTKLVEAVLMLLLLLNLNNFEGLGTGLPTRQPNKPKKTEPMAEATRHNTKSLLAAQPAPVVANAAATNQTLAEQTANIVKNITTAFARAFQHTLPLVPADSPDLLVAGDPQFDDTRLFPQNLQVNQILPASAITPVPYAGTTPAAPGIASSRSALGETHSGRFFYTALFGCFDRNQVRDGESSDKKNGYGGGFAVGYRKGKWGVEAGLAYAEKTYKPQRVTVEYENNPFTGLSLYYVDAVDASVVSAPVKVTRRMAKMGKVSAHAVAGVTASFAAGKRYGYKTLHFDPPFPAPNPDPQGPVLFPEGKGLLENGGLNKNAYVTADLGIRLERPIGRRYTAFVEPLYQRSLGGSLGPHAARINTWSLKAGVMTSL